MPQFQTKLPTSYRFGGALDGAMVGANATWQDGTFYNTAYGLATQGNVAVIGLIGGYDVTRNLSLSFVVNNLFDRTYYDGYGLFTSYTYGSPRNALVTARFKL